MTSPHQLARPLSSAIADGPIAQREIVSTIAQMLGKRWSWLGPMAKRLVARFEGGTRPRSKHVYEWLLDDAGFQRACRSHSITVVDYVAKLPRMAISAQHDAWKLPPIASGGQLADWLDITLDELEWLADWHGEERTTPPRFRRYRYRLLSKDTRRFRLLEVPIYRLKTLQRRVLSGILNQVEPHTTAQGFRMGRSIHTFAAEHVGKQVVLKMDLADYFSTIGFGRVSHLFRRIGYPERVADLLAAVCTNAVPSDVWDCNSSESKSARDSHLPSLFACPRLPQGAPTSPALANSCLFKVDLRLSGLANSCGAHYSRYADDIVFPGDEQFSRCVKRVATHIAATIMEEGFQVNHRKTRIMRASSRQRIVGIVVNRHANIQRQDFDELKAILHNCRKHGLESQNRQQVPDFLAHLTGRVSFVEAVNPERGKRLRALLNEIAQIRTPARHKGSIRHHRWSHYGFVLARRNTCFLNSARHLLEYGTSFQRVRKVGVHIPSFRPD